VYFLGGYGGGGERDRERKCVCLGGEKRDIYNSYKVNYYYYFVRALSELDGGGGVAILSSLFHCDV